MDEETFELLWTNCGAKFTHLIESLQDLQSSGIDNVPLEKERFMLDCLRVESPIPVPIRRKLAESNCEPHCTKENGQILDIEPIPFTVSKALTDGTGLTNTTIIIVVVSTSVVTFLVATLLFCWYTRAYGGVKNDEKPLLSLSTSSSQKPSYSVQKSNKDFGNGGDQLLSTKSDIKKTISSVNSSVTLGIPLEPPPANLSVAGIAPLKPPPGRPELALKTPPGMKDLVVPPPGLNTASPPTQSPAGGGAAVATAQVLSPSLTPSATPLTLHGPTRTASARRPPLAAPPPPVPVPSGKAPPPPPPLKQGPRPPPPPGGGKGPPRPPGGLGFKGPRPPSGPGDPDGDDSNKAKLKPFFWDKVMASPDQAMVWHQIRAGSFQFNEEMIENLFGYNASNEKNKGSTRKSSSQDPSSNFVQIIDAKKAQNLSILLKALNVTTNEVCDALKEGNELPVELIQTLLKMAPTGEEEMKLRLYNGDLSRLGTAEKFLKRLVEIPFAFQRLESLLFMCTLQEEQDIIKESFQTLEAACKQLRKSRLFLKLLEAVLKTGNRMNDGTFRGSAQAFKLDTLLKLSDVKGVDGKTTLLHFVVLEIIRAEGMRAAKTDDLLEEAANSSDPDEYYRNLGLQEVSRLCGELDDVKKAAIIDAEGLTGTVSRFGQSLIKAREFLNTDLKNLQENKNYEDDDSDDEDEFTEILSGFVQNAEKDIMWMLEEEKRIMALVKNTADYFHGQAGKDEGLRLFVIVRDFLLILDKVCKEIKETPLKPPPKPPIQMKDEKNDDQKEKKNNEKNDEKKDEKDGEKNDEKNSEKKDVKNDEKKDEENDEKKDGLPRRTTVESCDLKHETREGDGLQDGTRGSEDPRRKIKEIYELLHKIHDTKTPHKIEESDDFGHDTVDSDDPQHRTEENDDDVEPKTEENDDDMEPKTKEKDDMELKTQEDDDLQNELREPDGSKHKTQENDDDDMEPKTKEKDDMEHKTQEDDDMQNESSGSKHKTQEDDDDMEQKNKEDGGPHQSETEKKDDLQHERGEEGGIPKSGFRVPKERILPAIAMRRVDTFDSDEDLTSDED
ncbi:hypothetical protein L1887_05979 [Cichorium endivia]|nr:hypothetical protein L1887_05979 [Cichorium endivia]